MGVFSGGRIIGRIFVSESWEGLFLGGLINRITVSMIYSSTSCREIKIFVLLVLLYFLLLLLLFACCFYLKRRFFLFLFYLLGTRPTILIDMRQ